MNVRFSNDHAAWHVPLGKQDWRKEGLCYGDPEAQMWDDEIDGEERFQRAYRHKRAIAICKECPVRQVCRESVDPLIDSGVRGGQVLPSKRFGGRKAAS